MTNITLPQACAQFLETNELERTPEFYDLLLEFFGVQAQLMVPHAKNADDAIAYIQFHNLMDSLGTKVIQSVMSH